MTSNVADCTFIIRDIEKSPMKEQRCAVDSKQLYLLGTLRDMVVIDPLFFLNLQEIFTEKKPYYVLKF